MGGATNGDCQDSLYPSEVDNHWLNPDPSREGGTANVHIDNVVGPGSGDSMDFWLLADLPVDQPFVAAITDAGFDPVLGQFDGEVQVAVDGDGTTLPQLEGHVPASGQLLLGVTGFDDLAFEGEHTQVGPYTLRVCIIPEPTSVVLLALGGLALLLARMVPLQLCVRAGARR
jgi:hypothetical protein